MGKIKNKIGVFAIKAVYKIELWAVKHVMNKSHIFRYAAISHARIIASSIFESNTMSENIDVAIAAVYKLSNIETSDLKGEVSSEQVEELTQKLRSNKDVLNLVAEYHLTLSHAFTRNSLNDRTKYIDQYITEAKLLSADIEPFDQKSFNKRLKEVKVEQKYLKKQLNQILDNKIAETKQDNVGEISLESADIAILFSIFSSLFVVSGYYYNHSLLAEFNVNSDHFYLISDYISTSISLIITPILWTAIFIASYILGANDRLSNRIRETQLNIKINDKPPFLFPISIISMNVLVIFSILEGRLEIIDTMIVVNGLIVSFYFIEKIPFHYFKSPIKVLGCVIVCIGFIWNLTNRVNNEIQKITSEEYQPKYLVKFNEGTVDSESLEFIALNSNYVIMRNTDSRNIEIYPKSYINKLTTNPNQNKELNFIEWIMNFIEINSKLYEIITKETDKQSSEVNL